MVLDDNLQRVPHFLHRSAVHHLAGVFDVGGDLLIDQTLHDKRLKQFQRHLLWQAALVHFQIRANNDNRTAGVVDTFTQQVLTETSLFTFEHVGQRLERTVVRSGDRAAVAAVVDQRVNRLLQHALFVADDDVRRAQLDQLFQTVVAVDDPAVQVVQIAGGKASAVQLNHRADVRRDDRNNVQNHPGRLVAAQAERLDNLQPLQDSGALLSYRQCLQLILKLAGELLQIDVLQQLFDCLRAHHGLELVLIGLAHIAVFLLGKKGIFFQVGGSRIGHDVGREVQHLLQQSWREVEQQSHSGGGSLKVPDVGNRRRQFDVTHALAADLGFGDLNAAALTDFTLIAQTLILAAVALPVLGWTKDALAEQAVAFWFQGSIVDGLRLFYLAIGPFPDLFRRSQADFNRFEHIKFHCCDPFFLNYILSSLSSSSPKSENSSSRPPKSSSSSCRSGCSTAKLSSISESTATFSLSKVVPSSS